MNKQNSTKKHSTDKQVNIQTNIKENKQIFTQMDK